MKFGIVTSTSNNLKNIINMCIYAEKLGFDSFLLTDHFYFKFEEDLLDAWQILPYLASKTSEIKLGTCVTPLTFRNPLIFFKSIATFYFISNKRLILGLGAGWNKEEFEMFSKWLKYKERIKAFEEALIILNEALKGKKVNFQGKYYKAKNFVLKPLPENLEIWIGAHSEKMLRIAGKYCNGWIPFIPFIKDSLNYLKLKRIIEEELIKNKIKDKKFVYACRFNVSENSEKYIKEIENFKKVGLNYYFLYIEANNYKNEILKKFSEKVFKIYK